MATRVFHERFPQGEVAVYHPLYLPDGFIRAKIVRAKIDSRESAEAFILILSMILLSEAREGDKDELPSVVDSYDLLEKVSILRNCLEESNFGEEFFLTIKSNA